MRIVTGVGSRRVDEEGAKRVAEIACLLEQRGYLLRSGGAEGCDTIFEKHMTKKEIYLPWQYFNGNGSKYYTVNAKALLYASHIHPNWKRLNDAVKKLHGRNVYQVLGFFLNKPSDLLVCWTPDGCKGKSSSSFATGGTRTAIVLAELNHIPVYNLKNDDDYYEIKKLLKNEK